MPGYHWKGTAAQGFKLEGDLDASSKEGAIEQLRRRQITVSQIVETSAGGPIDTRPRERASKPQGFTRFKSLFVAAMFAAAAAAVGYIAPITFWTCERADGAVACSIAERDLGFIELRGWHLADVKSVDVETQMVTSSDRDRRTRPQKRIVFQDAKGGSIRSFGWDQTRPREWFQRPPVASTDVMFEEFQRFLGDQTSPRQSTWGVFWVPLILVGALLLLSLLTLSMTVASLFVRPEWAQALVAEHASRASKRTSKFR
jgi:hypothetical protein